MIRGAVAADESRWRQLWADYLAFYELDLSTDVTNLVWKRIMDANCPMSCRVAEVDGRVQAFCLWHHHLASWHVADDCYLEDLFVDPSARGQGLGRALIDDLMRIARERGFGRIYWHTEEDNARARALYDSYTPADGHIRYRMNIPE
ncbi:MAG: GNAT family N-acetyltransferase [Cereibacter sphaeroides]|uniref:GNAT family N-acetyltransferase n=1 Tax=Cereibacter sphaeroides TaxID=1063 RepID=A0A2W5U7F1_CERSP|nr:MAG: GNAT family N-acetyltransferase [Cereibacter sphaeroides]